MSSGRVAPACLAIFLLGCFVGWMTGQDSTRCAPYEGDTVCIATLPEGGTHAYDPRQEQP